MLLMCLCAGFKVPTAICGRRLQPPEIHLGNINRGWTTLRLRVQVRSSIWHQHNMLLFLANNPRVVASDTLLKHGRNGTPCCGAHRVACLHHASWYRPLLAINTWQHNMSEFHYASSTVVLGQKCVSTRMICTIHASKEMSLGEGTSEIPLLTLLFPWSSNRLLRVVHTGVWM